MTKNSPGRGRTKSDTWFLDIPESTVLFQSAAVLSVKKLTEYNICFLWFSTPSRRYAKTTPACFRLSTDHGDGLRSIRCRKRAQNVSDDMKRKNNWKNCPVRKIALQRIWARFRYALTRILSYGSPQFPETCSHSSANPASSWHVSVLRLCVGLKRPFCGQVRLV